MSTVEEVLDQVSMIALEDWGMCMVEPADVSQESDVASTEPMFLANVVFRGVLDGFLAVLCKQSFMESLCRNLLGLGIDDPVSVDEARDALRELTNVLSGNFLTEAYGDDTVFELIYPEVRQADEKTIRALYSSLLVKGYEADDETVVVALGTSDTLILT